MRILAIVSLALLTACSQQASEKLRPEMLRIQLLLEHGTSEADLRKAVEAARFDFESNRAHLSDGAVRATNDALASSEEFLSFASSISSEDRRSLLSECRSMVSAGAYPRLENCNKEMQSFRDTDSSDSTQSLHLFALQLQINRAVLSLADFRLKQAAALRAKKAVEAL